MKFTGNAINRFRQMVNESGSQATGVRFYTVQGCCSPALELDLAETPVPGDIVIQMEDVTVYISPEAESLLSEITLDYSGSRFMAVTETDKNAGNQSG
ncbi:MAG: hypothetical protein Kow00127_10380 [Bacteroidales bacterium]